MVSDLTHMVFHHCHTLALLQNVTFHFISKEELMMAVKFKNFLKCIETWWPQHGHMKITCRSFAIFTT